jgi:hypothetical protein
LNLDGFFVTTQATASNWLRVGTRAGFSEHDNETSGSIKTGKILKELGHYQLLNNHSAPGSYTRCK